MRRPTVVRTAVVLAFAMLAVLGTGLLVAPAASAATPRTVQVVVVPQYPGVHFTLEGMAEQTDATGSAVVPVPNLNAAAASLQLPEQELSPTLRVEEYKVASDPNHGSFSRKLVVELEADRAVSFNLVGPNRKTVPIQQVQSITLNSSLGNQVHLTAAQLRTPHWLPASVPAAVSAGIENRVVAYSVKSVMIHGANVVNTGQIRATAYRSTTWDLPVILRSLTVVGNNLLTGAGAGKSVQLTYPDGYQRTIPLGPGHRVTIVDLPRGTYGVKLVGGGFPIASSVRLSRNQLDDEVLVTYGNVLEVLAIVAVIVAAVAAAGVIGRRRRHELYGMHGGHGVAVT